MRVTLRTGNGQSVKTAYGKGGTLQEPHALGNGFCTIDMPNRTGMALCTDGVERLYDDIEVSNVIFARGSKRNPDGSVSYIPNDPAAYRGGRQSLKPFEVIPILRPDDFWLPPTRAKLDKMEQILDAFLDRSKMRSKPRLMKLLSNLEDKKQPLNTPFGDTDMGWQLSHYHHTAGGSPKVGYYNGVCPRGSAGFNNLHYGMLFWIAVNYIENPQFAQYAFMQEQATAHACYGHNWFGNNAGFARYEKGNNYIGENYPEAAWEKQFMPGMYLVALMTDNPYVETVINLKRQRLKESIPTNIWKGFWGARIASHYLEDLLLAYLYQPEQWIIDKAKDFMRFVKTLQLPNKCFPNKGNGGNAEESPWMQTQLITAMFRWVEVAPALQAEWSIDELSAAGKAIWDLGHTRIYGKPMLKYRFITKDVMPRSMHITAFAVPMLRFMAKHNESMYGALYQEVEDFVYDFAGTDIAGIVSDTPTPIAELGYRFPREGFGWSKAFMFYLDSLR